MKRFLLVAFSTALGISPTHSMADANAGGSMGRAPSTSSSFQESQSKKAKSAAPSVKFRNNKASLEKSATYAPSGVTLSSQLGTGGAPLTSASSERLASAVGHYARSHALLISAIREFDKGFQLANPSSLVEVSQWRSGVIDRAEELQTLLAPQPRTSETGIKLEGDSRILNEAR